jgi:hypothetical protein
MAIVARTFVGAASQTDHDRLNESVERRLVEQGGPPDGLMSLVTHPHEAGFIIVQVWRSEDTFAAFDAGVLAASLAEAGLTADAAEILPVWGFARP